MPPFVLLLLRRTVAGASLMTLMTLPLTAAAAPQQPTGDAAPGTTSPAPDLDPPSITPPADQVAPDGGQGAAGSSPRDTRVRDRIRDALRGGEGGASATGDAILDDVIGIIRTQGSVLDGTTLEQDVEAVLPPGAVAPGAPHPDAATIDVSEQRYRVAESLLRTARLLSGLPDADGQRQSLVRQLRMEAARCLLGP